MKNPTSSRIFHDFCSQYYFTVPASETYRLLIASGIDKAVSIRIDARPMARLKAEIVDLKTDGERVLAAIAYAIHQADEKGIRFTQYDVVKSLFLADRAHLNKFGRLITSDTYVAMIHGPVPSCGYNLLKGDARAIKQLGLRKLPWEFQKGTAGKIYFHSADVSEVDDILSPSDKSAIEDAVSTVSSLSFGQIRKLTHEDAAYIDAWEDDSDRKQFPMSLGLLFDTPNFDKAREIRDISKL